ncbi:DUF3977 family protein [Paenibacillus odorifer]|uniref:DUF3977 domain-containing protein n=1 Tax=Paenibacillus odorifer TaxID=189426 RepID=A0A1R0Y484_9BACL|nr:DUF3977 family protein [Paenibacillus odorifer]OMD42156.1 hypothetical protein BSK52_08630 [Paenibacillus odorifer]
MKYIEFGLGNTWFIRTETELEDGNEFEEKGIVKPVRFHSLYFRIWIGKTVVVLDLKQGFKISKKSYNTFKIIFGITSL